MKETYNADEVFEMAEQIERNGAKFYRKAAGMFSREKTRQMLLSLAVMEEDHEKIFSRMRAQFLEKPTQVVQDPNEDAVLYLRALVDRKIFRSDPTQLLNGDEKIEEVLDRALELEKDSIIFYMGIKELVPDGREHVNTIIREEMKHITLLHLIRTTLE